MDTEDLIAAGDEPLRADDIAEGAEAPEDIFELELDGQVHSLPGALKGAFLRQADYTRKTQELAEHRRELEAHRKALAEQARSVGQASQDRLRLAALDEQLAGFEDVDWETYSQQDPQGAQTLHERFEAMARAREELAYAVTHQEERVQLQAAREAAERMAQTGQTLAKEIEGWSPEVAARLIDYAQAFGVTLEELREAADPRLWKLLHRAYQADETTRQEGAAKAVTQAQAVRPAVLVTGAGSGAGGVRDELATKDWMARRNAQMTKGR